MVLGWGYSHVFPSLSSSTRGWTVEPDVNSVHRFTMDKCGLDKAPNQSGSPCLSGNGDNNSIVLYTVRRIKWLVQVKHLEQFLAQWKSTVDFIFVFISNEHLLCDDPLDKTFVEVDRGETF